MRNNRSRFPKILLIALALPVILLILTFGLIQTRPVKNLITAKVNSLDLGGVDIELENLSGLLPFHIRLERLSCYDPHGQFANGQNLKLDISPWRLLRGNLEIDHLSLRVLDLRRLPQLPDQASPEPEAEPSTGFDLPLSVFMHEIEIPSLSLGPDLLGQQAELALSAKGSWQSMTQWNMLCNLNQTNTRGLNLHLAAGMQGSDSRLDVDVDFQDQPDGLALGQLGLDLPAPLRLRIQGTGPLADWKGKIHLDMDGQSLAETDLGLQADSDRFEVRADSSIQPQPLLPKALRPVQSGLKTVDLSLAATAQRNLRQARLMKLTVNSGLARIRFQGQADFTDQTGKGSGSIVFPNLQSLQPMLGTTVSGSARLDMQAQGAWASPDLVFRARGNKLHVHGLDFKQTGLTLRPQLIRSDAGRLERILVNAELQAEAVHKEGLPQIPGPLEATLRSSLELPGPDLDLEALHLAMPGIDMSVRGQAKSSGPYQATLRTEIDDLSSIPQLQNTGLSAGLQMSSEVQGNWQQASLKNELSAVLKDMHGLPQTADEILGPQLTVQSQTSLHSGQKLTLETLRIQGRQVDMRAQGDMDLDGKKLRASWSVDGPDFSALNHEAFSDISGIFKSSGHISGDLQELTTSLAIQGTNLTGPGFNASTFHSQFQGRIQPFKPKVLGDIQLRLQEDSQEIVLQTGIDFDRQILRLPDVHLQAPETVLTAAATYQSQDQSIHSKLQLEAGSLQWLQAFTPSRAQGGLDMNAEVNGPLSQPQISAAGRVRDLQMAETAIDSLDFQTDLKDAKTFTGSLELEGENVRYGDTRISHLDVEAEGSQGQIKALCAVSGKTGEDFDLRTQAQITDREDSLRITLPQGQGHYGELPLSWSHPLQAAQAEQGWELSWPELHLGQGTVSIQGKSEGNAVHGSVQAQNIDLNTLPLAPGSDFTGQADLEIQLSGSRSAPVVHLDTRIRNLQSQIGQAEDLPKLNVQAAGTLDSKELQAEVSVDGDKAFDLQSRLNLPVDFALHPFQFQPKGSVSGQIQGQADLQVLSASLPLDGQDLAGTLSMDISCSGSLPLPELHGELQLAQGKFENVQTGTLLQEIQTVIHLQGHRAVISEMQATDGEQGKIQVAGELGFAPDQDISYSLTTSLDQATLVRMEPATATLSGSVDLQGTPSGADITGDLKAFPVEIGLPDPAPSGLDGLTIIQAGEQKKSELDFNGQDTPSFAQSTNLDLQVNIPGGCYVRGRGLDSEWEGDLHIQGTAAQPRISGYIAIVRGHLNLLTKRFTLDEGRVTFLSRFPPQPELDLTALTSVRDLQAKIHITGPATEPSLTLSSEPALPRDEILARILFNRDLSQITPVQAVKLALAVRTLTSGGNGGFMTSLRQNMGLDELTIETQQSHSDSEDSSQVTLGAGKYLSEDIYFKVEKGLEEDSGRATVNIQLTPRFSVESTAGSEHQGLYISWSYSY
ncbi:MAG: translocation/assembly module TamB domain-containing protein [Thermodesulfobacteriota bacterium]